MVLFFFGESRVFNTRLFFIGRNIKKSILVLLPGDRDYRKLDKTNTAFFKYYKHIK